MSSIPAAVPLTSEEKYALDVTQVGLMSAAPFYAYYYYAEMRDVPTRAVPTLATDGRHIFWNPDYLKSLKPQQRVFAFAHEISHVVSRHPQRMKHYGREGQVRSTPYEQDKFNEALDYVVNADLIENGTGVCNPSWLFDPKFVGSDLGEDVYEKIWKKKPPGPGGGAGQGGGSTYGKAKGLKGVKGDAQADANGGSFDQVLPPPTDPVTGQEDIPDESAFREAIARAAAAAKAMGKLPASIQRLVDDVMQPQVDWREHVRALLTGHMGSRRETWDRPNRRRLVLNPMIVMPGRRGYGAHTVACVIDNSGSIGEKELSAFFSEVGGVLADVRPKRVVLIWCDAAVQQVDTASSLDELQDIRVKGSPGGGGTSFIPPFEYLANEGITPETLIYITDMYGSFPAEPPPYPVVWCASTEQPAPWGDVVRIKVE